MNFNKVSFIVSLMLMVTLLGVSSYTFLIKPAGNPSSFLDIPASANRLPEEKAVSSTDTGKDTSASSKSTAVSGKAVVKGKVTDKYISPYTANTSYKNVYLKNNTELKIDLKSLLNSPLKFKIGKSKEPKVLILHTHATECFLKSNKDFYTASDKERTTDTKYNMVSIGKIIAGILNKEGITTLQSQKLHDYPDYNRSYSLAANTICSYLEKYPSIKVVMDIHRDSVGTEKEKVKLTKKINGKTAAQVMLVMGSQSGGVKNFPKYKENLKLAVKIQNKLEQKYPGLARSICLNSKNYNESLTLGSVLIEIGTDANSYEEALYSAKLVGNALAELFKDL